MFRKLIVPVLMVMLAPIVFAQLGYVPRPVAGFTYSGSSWIAAATTSSGSPLGYTPDPVALYCLNSGTGKWVPADSNCFGGGSGTVSDGAGTTTPNQVAVSTGTAHVIGYVAPIVQWQRQPSPVISPYSTDTSQQVQETSAILDTSPEILTNYSQVVKLTWTDGWYYSGGGGAGVGICFGESPDGITPPTRSATCPIASTVNHARSWLMKNPTGAGYILYATNLANGQIDQFTGTSVAGITLAHSNVLACGSNGNESAGTTGNTAVWYDTAQTPHWRMLYDCVNTAGSGSYADWLATSTDGVTWTKFQTAPVVGYGSGVTMGGNCADCGGAWVAVVGGKTHAYVHGGPVGVVPTPYIYHMVDSTGVGNAWVADAAPTITSRTAQEGVSLANGQIADAFALDMGALNQSLLFFEETPNGCPNQATCSTPMYIEVAAINQPLSSVVQETQTDGPSSQSVPTIQVNGVPLNSNSMLNLIGPYQTSNGQVTVGGGYVATPGYPGSSGAQGQWSVSGAYLYAYDSGASLWGRVALAETGWGYQAYDTFTGSTGTAISAHTDTFGNTYALYTNSGSTPQSIPLIDPTSGLTTLNVGGGLTYGDVLSTLTPTNADYTISITCQRTGAGAGMAIFGRANSAATTYYLIYLEQVAYHLNLGKEVTGTFTSLQGPTGTWALNDTHTISLKMSGTAISMGIDGVYGATVTDSGIASKGQAGFRVTQGMQCTNFIVQ